MEFARRRLSAVRMLKTLTAALLVLLWLPATSLCLLESAGFIEKGDCCSKVSDRPAPGKTGCDQPCGIVAAGQYLSQQDHFVLSAPVFETPNCCIPSVLENRSLVGLGRDVPSTAPPELVTCRHFFFRTALAPRAPSLVS
jgi:hypothetical protein